MSETEEKKDEAKDEAKTGLMGKIEGYGATITGKKPETPRDGPEEKEPKPWEARGTILGLCIDLGMIIWIQSVPLATMFIHSMVSTAKCSLVRKEERTACLCNLLVPVPTPKRSSRVSLLWL